MVMSAFLQAEMILESYAEVDSKQFKTGNMLHQLVQCSMVPNNKWLQIINNQKLISTVSCEFKISTHLFLGLQPHEKAAMLGVSTTDYMEIEVSSQGGEMHLFLTTNMPRDVTCKPAPCVQVEWSELFVRFFLVRVLFIVFFIFCITSFGDCTRPQRRETTRKSASTRKLPRSMQARSEDRWRPYQNWSV